MKWTIAQLNKIGKEPFSIDETLDFSEVAKLHHDVKGISLVTVKGTGQVTGKRVVFNLQIRCTLTLLCAITLDEVKYPLNIDVKEIFSFDENEAEADDDIIYVKQTVELASIVWQNIVLHIPLRVVKEGAYDQIEKSGENYTLMNEDEYGQAEEESVDPRFSALKDFFKEDN